MHDLPTQIPTEKAELGDGLTDVQRSVRDGTFGVRSATAEELSRVMKRPADASLTEEEKKFMALAEESKTLAGHDDACALRKGKDCGCRDNLRRMNTDAPDAFAQLEEKLCGWTDTTYRKPTVEERIGNPELKTVAVKHEETAILVRVDNGKVVEKRIADPISPDSGRLITIEEQLPPRWICLECAQSMRSVTADAIDHRCDTSDLARTKRPIGLERTIPPTVRFGGGYRLTLWRDKAGEYHLGEEVVVSGRVVEERHLYGPDSYSVIEGAILDAAVNKLAP